MRPLTGETRPTGLLPTRARRVLGIALRGRLVVDAGSGRASLVGGGAFNLLFSHDA